MTTFGLLLRGVLVDVPGVTVVPPASHGGPAWNALHPGDCCARPLAEPSQVVPHTTGGHWPQPILSGAGPAGHAREILEMWSGRDRGGGELIHSAAHIVIDFDGTVYCAADLVAVMAYHAEGSNPRSVGIEMCTTPNGGIYEATLTAGVRTIAALTWSGQPGSGLLAIPAQMPDRYHGEPLMRMETGAGALRRNTGGHNCAGVFGHRHNTGERGRGDPGDELFKRLSVLEFESLDYDGEQDLVVGRVRQRALNGADAHAGNSYRPLVVDGVCGPASIAAARRLGFARWRDVPAP